MDYNRWFRETFATLFRDTRLWLLISPWFLILWLAQALSGGFVVGWEGRLRRFMSNPAFLRPLSEVETFKDLVRIFPYVFYELLGFRFYLFLGLLALSVILWILQLMLTVAVIYHTMPGHEHPPRLEASVHVGLKYAPCIFLVDLISAVFVSVLLLPFIGGLVLIVIIGTGHPPSDALGAFLVSVLVGGLCFLVLYALIGGFFIDLYRNLTYQACVQERNGVAAALGRAWTVLRQRPGPVILLGLIALVVGWIVELIQSGFSQVLQVLILTKGPSAIFGMVFWGILAGLVALIAVIKKLFVLLIYTKAWPDIAGTAQVAGEEV